MDFPKWVDSVGSVEKAAEILKESPRAVYSWYRLERAPRLASALNIVAKTNGLVDYNGIYGPVAKAKVAA
ncbi:hypothetical protein ACYVMD_004595 [Vibrio parahaemolyticus]|nr:hypothetical protein [Vibrio parahaemolyticus]EJC7066890.1 hypothetical protein [Vibrio parahaemolyticus]EJG1615132.1 hypothetical protein [Vibrio parahaemolyticus]